MAGTASIVLKSAVRWSVLCQRSYHSARSTPNRNRAAEALAPITGRCAHLRHPAFASNEEGLFRPRSSTVIGLHIQSSRALQ